MLALGTRGGPLDSSVEIDGERGKSGRLRSRRGRRAGELKEGEEGDGLEEVRTWVWGACTGKTLHALPICVANLLLVP